MDSDFHSILNYKGEKINSSKPIIIGDHVWIGCRNTILKGVKIGDNIVVSANSTITRTITEENCVIGGHGKAMEVIKREIGWQY